jgi:chaperonin cofactor prefoldin
MSDNTNDDPRDDISGNDSIDLQSATVTSTYKVLGQFDADNGVGVLGQNDANSGTPIGVQGAVPNSSAGYGLATPDDAKVGGTAELNTLGGTLTSNQTVTDLLGDGLTVSSGAVSVSAGRTLTASGSQVNFAGPAEWENVGDTATNTASGSNATVLGGKNNEASGAYSTAMGRNATANKDGSFVVGDSSESSITSGVGDEARFQTSLISESFVETGSTFDFTNSGISLTRFNNSDGDEEFEVQYFDVVTGSSFPILGVDEFGVTTIYNNLVFDKGVQSDTGTNVVINSNNELAAESSSARHKTDIQPHLTSDGVLDLELRSFQYEETGSEDVGLIAEEVKNHVPEIVTYDDEDRPFGVKYDRVGPHLVPEVRDNRDRLDDIESDHEAMDDRVAELEAELDAKDTRLDDQQDQIAKLNAENDRLTAENKELRERIEAIEAELEINTDQQVSTGD